MGRTASKTYYNNGFSSATIQVPAGVKYITVTTVKPNINARAAPCVNGMGFIDTNQNLFMTGNEQNGVLGVGDLVQRSSPTQVAGTQTFIQLIGGINNSNFALNTQGQLYGWGANGGNGSLGNGGSADVSSPVPVVGGLTFQSMSTSGNHTIALDYSGKAYSWGLNANGQLGLGDVTKRSSPVAVVGGLFFQKVITLGSGSMGLTLAGDIYSWGAGSSGELGLANSGTVRSSPTLVTGGFTWLDIKSNISVGGSYVLALRNNGSMYGVGANDVGQLGTGDASNRDTFSNNAGPAVGETFEQFFPPLTSTTNSCFAITNKGNTYGWGSNVGGVLGDGTNTFRSSPVLVVGGYKFKKIISTGGPSNGSDLLSSTYGLTFDGKIYAWGKNTEGGLGDGTSTPRSSPTLVIGGYTWADFYCNAHTSVFGLTTGGQIYAWGRNDQGALGVGDAVNRSSPTLIAGNYFVNNTPTINTLRLPIVVIGSGAIINFGRYFTTIGGIVVGQQLDSLTITWQE